MQEHKQLLAEATKIIEARRAADKRSYSMGVSGA